MSLLNAKTLLRSSLLYTIINFINKAFPFLLLPILTRELSLQEYGGYNLVKALIGILIPCIGMNVSDGIIKNYFTLDKADLSSYISTSIIITLASLSLFGLISYLLIITGIYSQFGLQYDYVLIGLLISFFTSINNIERGLLRNENNNTLFAILVLSQTILFFCSVGLLYFLGKLSLSSVLIAELFCFAS